MEELFRFSLPDPPEGEPVSLEQAERILREGVARHPEGSKERRDAQWQLMRFLSETERADEGLEILTELLAATADPEERAEIVLATGQLMERLGDFPSAIAAYSRGVALEPVGARTWYLLHNNLGYCLNQLGRYAEAERWCGAAIRVDPERHNAHKNLAIAYQGQGRYADAAHSFIDAVHREASDPRALRHLEDLIDDHPTILTEMPDLSDRLERCRVAVGTARRELDKRRRGSS